MKWTLEKSVASLLATSILFIGTTIYFLYQTQTKTAQLTSLKASQRSLEKEYRNQTKDLKRLTERYEDLYAAKEGTAQAKLIEASEGVFENVYNVDTSKEEDSVAKRRERALAFSTESGLESLLPSSAEGTRPSVTSVSRLTEIQVFIKSSNSNHIVALVLVDYSISISGSETMTSSLLYQVNFDQFDNKLTKISTIGQFNLPE